MSKHLKFIVALAVAGSLLFGAQARAVTVTDIISAILDDMEGFDGIVDHVNPIVFEDDDFTELVDVGGPSGGFGDPGDIVRGIFDLPAIRAGFPQDELDPTKIVKDTPVVSLDVAGLELTGAFELVVLGPGPVPGSLALGPVPVASRTLLKSLVAGTMIEMFEDPANDYNAGVLGLTLAADAVFAQGGTLFAELGVTGAGTEFYTISGTPGSEDIEYALNFTVAPPPLGAPWNPPTMEPWLNSLGTYTYGIGDLETVAPGKWYQRASDVDTIILYAPVPAAIGPGIALLGVLGLVYRRRRRA